LWDTRIPEANGACVGKRRSAVTLSIQDPGIEILVEHSGEPRLSESWLEAITEGKGGTVTLKLASWMIPVRYLHIGQVWKDNGLPPNVPFFMTEGNMTGDGERPDVMSGLWLADYVGSMMTEGAIGCGCSSGALPSPPA